MEYGPCVGKGGERERLVGVFCSFKQTIYLKILLVQEGTLNETGRILQQREILCIDQLIISLHIMSFTVLH